MKLFVVISSLVLLVGCGTAAGTLRGFGEDVKSGTDTVSDWIKPNQRR